MGWGVAWWREENDNKISTGLLYLWVRVSVFLRGRAVCILWSASSTVVMVVMLHGYRCLGGQLVAWLSRCPAASCMSAGELGSVAVR